MAIQKEIMQDNGIVTNYHRVLYVMNNPNSHVSVAICSYMSDEARGMEKDGTIAGAYRVAKTYETTDYDCLTFEQAYEWLKTLPEFEGATDC